MSINIALRRVRDAARLVAAMLQKLLVSVLLLIVYILGFGLTSVLLRLFRPRVLSRHGTAGETSWHEAEGYEAGTDDHLRQA